MTDNDNENDPEGVRIIGADETSDAIDRDDMAARRGAAPPPDDGPAFDRPEPVLRFPLSSDASPPPDDLPHWTEPPTGTTEAVGGETIFDRGESDSDWSGFAASPRWRDAGDQWDDGDDVRAFAGDPADEFALGQDRPDPEEFFTFDELDDAPAGRSVFGDDVEPLEDDEDLDYDDPDASGPRKIVVGGGRVSPGAASRPPAPSASGVGGDRNLSQAAVVGVAFLGAAAAAFVIGPWAAALFVSAVVTFAAAELFTKLREVGYQPAALLGIAATLLMVVGAYHRGVSAIPIALVLTVAFSMFWFLFGAGEGQVTLNVGVTLFGVAWVGMFGSFATALLGIQGPGIPGNPGTGILFGAILGTVAYDVGGYFVGRSAGRSPLSGASPNKTIEGLVGGCVAAVTVALIYSFLSGPFDGIVDGLRLGLAVAIAAPLGDLAQSLIKRDLGIKDMGSILPGHGGLMDRFDALLFVLPATYYMAQLADFYVG